MCDTYYNNTTKDDKTTKDGDYELFIRARSEQGHATATAGLALGWLFLLKTFRCNHKTNRSAS